MEDILIPEIKTTKPQKTAIVPNSDIDFGKVIKTVGTKWTQNPWLTLKWLTPAQFVTNSTTYENTLTARVQTGASRPQITQAFKALDKTIDESLVYVKGYIVEKHNKEMAKSFYPSFGIEHVNKSYVFPADQNKRAVALGLMLAAIQENGFADKDYGTAFWTPIKSQYDNLIQAATSTDSKIALKAGDKKLLRKELDKALKAIVHAIKANYPENYKEELRNWGFQKEKY
jgi:hypothetical protein